MVLCVSGFPFFLFFLARVGVVARSHDCASGWISSGASLPVGLLGVLWRSALVVVALAGHFGCDLLILCGMTSFFDRLVVRALCLGDIISFVFAQRG